MSEDISKNTLLILVALTIIISLLGTWTVINEAVNVRSDGAPSIVPSQGSASGKVAIDIEAAPKPVTTSGKVILTIERNE